MLNTGLAWWASNGYEIEEEKKMKIILHKNCFEKVDGFLMLTLLV